MAKIIILSGIPGSGKTTWVKDFVKDHENYFVVSRDSIRFMKDRYWRPKDEGFIEDAEWMLAQLALNHGFNIIIDDTNIYFDKWTKLAEEKGAEVEVKYFDIDPKVAIQRVKERVANGGHDVAPEIIINFHKRYSKKNEARIHNQDGGGASSAQ